MVRQEKLEEPPSRSESGTARPSRILPEHNSRQETHYLNNAAMEEKTNVDQNIVVGQTWGASFIQEAV